MTTTPTGDAETLEGLRADHPRIWLEPRSPDDRYGSDGRTWCQDKVWPEHEGQPEPTEYVRADIGADHRETLLREEALSWRRTAERCKTEATAAEARALRAESQVAEAKGALGTALSEMLEARDRLLASGARTSGLDFGIEEAHKALANLETKEPSDV